MKWSLVMPIKDEVDLLEHSLVSCYKLEPSEVVLCFDNPPDEKTFQKAKEIASRFDIPTQFVKVDRNPDWKFHQAYVRRIGFLKAKYDRILTVDADLVVNANVFKAVKGVEKNNIGLVSCGKFNPVRNLLGIWRMVAYHIARQIYPVRFTGLYALWRPYWLNSEDEGIKNLEDPRLKHITGTLVSVGEDTYLRNCMQLKHHCVYLKDIGCRCLTRYVEDVPHVQFETGRYLFEHGHRLLRVLIKTLMYTRPHILRGYLYQKRVRKKIPIASPITFTKNLIETSPSVKEYWEKDVPMSFIDKPLSYEEKRKFRYSLQDYMNDAFHFGEYKNNLVLDLGCGSGIDSVEFARHGAKVVSADLTKKATRLTKQLFIKSKQSGDVIQASATHLPFRELIFDCVYTFGVLHHIPDVEDALAEIRRILRIRGVLLAMVYNKDSLLYAYSILYRGAKECLSAEESLKKFSERREGCPYTKVYTKDEAKQLFGAYFDKLEFPTHYNVIDLPNKRKTKFHLDENANLGWHLIVKGIRKGGLLRKIF